MKYVIPSLIRLAIWLVFMWVIVTKDISLMAHDGSLWGYFLRYAGPIILYCLSGFFFYLTPKGYNFSLGELVLPILLLLIGMIIDVVAEFFTMEGSFSVEKVQFFTKEGIEALKYPYFPLHPLLYFAAGYITTLFALDEGH